ncbi:MAG: AAA family ATPase [bacterium]|nr:AAA family ATPase [bacterium]
MKERADEFIEREIIIGLLANDDFIDRISKVYTTDCLASGTAKTLASWCLDHFNKYGKAPGRDIEGIYMQKLQEGLPKDRAEDIENILQGLSDEYDRDREQFNADFLFDRTIKHFQDQQARVLLEQQWEAINSGDFDEFYALTSAFKPVALSDLFEDESISAGELYDMEITGPRWLVEDLIPAGLTIMGGRSKVGKSYFTLNLAMSLAQGKKMFGEGGTDGFRGQRSPVLYLSLEDTKERFTKRMREIDPEPDLELLDKNLSPKFQWDKLRRGGLKKIEEWVKATKGRNKLVVIDTLAKVWDKKSTTGGGGLYAEEYSIYGGLADLAHKHGTSILLITHTTKGKAQDVFDEILGGAGTQAPADNLIVLANDQGGRKRFSIRGKDIEEKHLAFETSGGPANWVCLGEAAEAQKTAERQELYDLLAEEGPMELQDIKREVKERGLGISPNSVATVLRKMLDDGVLEQPKKYGPYAIAGTQAKVAASKITMRRTKAQ